MELDRLLAQLDETGLAEFFSANALARARGYVGRVSQLEGTANILQANVQGTERRPYKVWVRIERREFFGERSIDLATRCTCPVGNRCKHAAALILAARREGAIADKPRAEIAAWARGLRQRLDSAGKAPRKTPVRDAIIYVFRPRPGGDDMELALAKVRFSDGGRISGGMPEWTAYEQALLKPPSFVQESDLHILRLLRQIVR
ncbi:MAG: SWIM zinc finger family protein, partial [Rhodoferax sp.]|nr:SWIM zinc finger family protein [Rhodoferax sp.]